MLPRKKGGVRLALNYISYFISASILGPWMLRNVKFDVIFVYEPSPITVGIPAIVLKKIKKAPVLFWVLDLWPETPVALGALRSKVLISLVGSLARYIYNRCDLVLGQSMGFVEQIKKYCDISGVELNELDQTNEELGSTCKKPFSINCCYS